MNDSSEFRSLRDWLEQVRRRPAMYLGSKSLSALESVCYGCWLACQVHAMPESRRLNSSGLDADFARWLAAEKGIGEGSKGAIVHLVELTGDDAAALDRFFELLDEYEAVHGRS